MRITLDVPKPPWYKGRETHKISKENDMTKRNPKMDPKSYLTVTWTCPTDGLVTRGFDDTRHGKIRASWCCDWLDEEGTQYQTNFNRKPSEVTA